MRSTIFTITDEWIKQNNPCEEAIEWWDKKERDTLKILKLLIEEKRYFWANWLIVRVMNYGQNISYAVFAAEQVIDIFEKKFPDDKRPRQAIEAARKCINNPSQENKITAYAAAHAAHAAVYAVDAAVYAAHAAVYAVDAVAYAAYAAVHAAVYAATDVAVYAVHAAVYAVDAAAHAAHTTHAVVHATRITNKMKIKILEYGVELLKADE